MVKTNVFQDKAGNKFDATEIIKGIVKTWTTDDIVSLINKPVSAEAIEDNSGRIVSYKYFAIGFSKMQDRKQLVEKDRKGEAIAADPITAEEITVHLDDEISIGPDYIDNWDANKIEARLDLYGAKNGQYPEQSKLERAERYFEAVRKVAKAASAAALGDGVTRIVDITAVTDDIALTKLYQDAANQQASVKNSRRKGTPKSSLCHVMPLAHITRISNTQAFTGSNVAGQQLAEGAIGKLDGVDVFPSINTNGIGYTMIKGAVVLPIANPEMVTYPSKSNSIKFAFEFALSAAGSEGVLYADGVVALGDPAEINK